MLSFMLLNASATRLLNSLTSGSALLPGVGFTASSTDPRVAATASGMVSVIGGPVASLEDGGSGAADAAAAVSCCLSCKTSYWLGSSTGAHFTMCLRGALIVTVMQGGWRHALVLVELWVQYLS